jgi:hypothetical protein
LETLIEYHTLISEIDAVCLRIKNRYAKHIRCVRGCAGNCCRIHLSIHAIEAFSLARALKKVSPKLLSYIRGKAVHTISFGPCPLLDNGACLMYASRLVICRTHGLPALNEYNGRRAIGCCQKNFQQLNPIPEDAAIDIDQLNHELAAINQRFVAEISDRRHFPDRLPIAKAVMLDI